MIVDHGIRLGTNESTRRGMKVRDMEKIAELILRVYKGEEPSRVRRAATKMRKEFKTIEYT
jgi:glycine hydroxymethyltransferase